MANRVTPAALALTALAAVSLAACSSGSSSTAPARTATVAAAKSPAGSVAACQGVFTDDALVGANQLQLDDGKALTGGIAACQGLTPAQIAGIYASALADVPPAPAPSSAPVSSPAAPASTAVPASPAAASSSPSMTTAQQQAVDAAQSYLALGQGFSYEGLLQQLTSSDGSGFAESDAEYAISYLKPDWDQQAVDAARSYLALGQGFSYAGLLQQLTSGSGSGFTQVQAEYAISYLKPDWDQQAVDAAKGYLKLGGFSQDSLIQQLTSSAGGGFTQAQAEYAADKVGL
jgi:hypothetical protein